MVSYPWTLLSDQLSQLCFFKWAISGLQQGVGRESM
jgi:hypothetical protein